MVYMSHLVTQNFLTVYQSKKIFYLYLIRKQLLTRGQISMPVVRVKSSLSCFRDFSSLSTEVETFSSIVTTKAERERERETCFTLLKKKLLTENFYL